jgi:hypothetical protein
MNTDPQHNLSSEKKRSLIERLLSWRALRAALLGIAILVTLAALLVSFEGFRAGRAWTNYRAELEATGERFFLDDFAPGPVPHEQNFAATPYILSFWEANGAAEPRASIYHGNLGESLSLDSSLLPKGQIKRPLRPPNFGSYEQGTTTDLNAWADYYQSAGMASPAVDAKPADTVLEVLSKFEPIRRELEQAKERPYAVMPPLNHSSIHTDQQKLLSAFAEFKAAAQFLRLHSAASLSAGNAEDALDNVMVSFRLADTLKSQPLLITHLVRIAVLAVAGTSVHEGIMLRQWNETQLASIQELVQSIDMLADHNHVMRGERAYFNTVHCEQLPSRGLASKVTRPFFLQSQLRVNQLFQDGLLGAIDPVNRRFNHVAVEEMELPALNPRSPYTGMARSLAPAMEKISGKSARSQTVLDQIAVACAIERYRQAHGKLPGALAELVPRYIGAIPGDVMDGEPLRYQLNDEGTYTLYSVGLDLEDNRGLRVKASHSGDEVGDWIWVCR